VFFSFALEYAITEVQENQVGLKLNGTHQFLAYADYVNLLGDNTDTIKRKTKNLIDACKEVGLEINTEKTEYILLSHHQNAWQNQDIKIVNRSFGTAPYLGMTVIDQNLIQAEVKKRMNLGNASYH
jgi:Flp pilus assembly CpaE family ATPase